MSELCLIDDDVRRKVAWALYYYEEWGVLPNPQQQKALNSLPKQNKFTKFAAVMEELRDKFSKEGGRRMPQTNANEAVNKGVNRLLAREILRSSMGEAVDATGRRAAVFVEEEGARLEAAIGDNIDRMGVAVAELPVAITTMAGEFAEVTLGEAVTDGAVAGAGVAGLFGVAIGAAVGAGGWLIDQMIDPRGADHTQNRCDMETGDIGVNKLWFGTYKRSNGLCLISYWHERLGSNQKVAMSAGQQQEESFQLRIYFKGRDLVHLRDVYYTDTVRVVLKGGQWRIFHGKGAYNKQGAGTTSLFYRQL